MLTATRGPYLLVVQQDDSPFNPREDDNFGKMVCFHRQYSLGDHHNYIDKDDFLRDLYLKTVGDDERGAHRYERALDLMNYKIKAPFDSAAYEREVDERLMKVISQKYLMLPPGRRLRIVCAERWNITIPTFAARLMVMNCIKMVSWKIAAGALSAVMR